MCENFVPTKVSAKKNEEIINFQSIKFKAYQSKKKSDEPEQKLKKSQQGTETNEFNIKKAKHEIIKFGMSAFDPQEKAAAKIQLAVKLGAKPLKNKYKNYKVLKQERAKEKKDEKLKTSFQQLGKNSVGKSLVNAKKINKKRKKRKDGGGILDVYGKAQPVA